MLEDELYTVKIETKMNRMQCGAVRPGRVSIRFAAGSLVSPVRLRLSFLHLGLPIYSLH